MNSCGEPNYLSTFAGGGSGGDNGPANQAALSGPTGVAVDTSGNVYIADTNDQRVRMVTPGGTISTVAGNGLEGLSGNGGAATSAMLNDPNKITVTKGGLVYIADTDNGLVRLLTPTAQPAGAPPSIKAGGVVSASAFGAFATIAPGSWIEIYGSNLASDSREWAGTDFNGGEGPDLT